MVQQFPLFADNDEALGMDEMTSLSVGAYASVDPTDILAVCIDVFSAMPSPSLPVKILLSGDIGHDVRASEERVLDVLTALMSAALPEKSAGYEDLVNLSVKAAGDVLRIDLYCASPSFTGVIWDCQTELEPILTRPGEASHVAWWNDRGWCLTAYINLDPNDQGMPWLVLTDSGHALPFQLEAGASLQNIATTSLLIVLGD